MHIVSRKILREFWEKHSDARQPLQAWFADVQHAHWTGPKEIKAIYHNASFLPGNRVVFNIKGNTYQLVVVVQYKFGYVYIRFIGTHQEYDRINAGTI